MGDAGTAVVIGSGVGGLTSAILLAARGWQVTVLEQHVRAGGFLHRFFREGVGYDTGFHYVGAARPDQLVGRMLRHVGVYGDLAFHPLDPDGFDILRFPDLEVSVPAGLDRWMDRLGTLFPAERDGLRRYAELHRAAVDAYGWYRLAPLGSLDGLLAAEAQSVAEVLSSCIRDPRLARILAGQAALYGVAPDEAPFGLHALVTDHFLTGASTLQGGGDRLALSLVRRLRALGGRIQFRARATAVELTGGAVSAVVAGERRFPADLVVANLHPQNLLPLLPEDAWRRAWRTRVSEARPGRAHVGVYLRVRGDLSDLADRNLYRTYTWGDPSEDARPGHVPFLFLTAPGARDPRGQGVVLGLVPAAWAPFAAARAESPEAYRALKEGMLASILDRLRQDYPRWEIVRAEASTPVTTWRYTSSPEGATYGHYHSVAQMGRARFPPYGRVPGLWQVGQAVGFPGICGAMMTAFVACEQILGGPSLMDELRELP